jgi:hypothetical protein
MPAAFATKPHAEHTLTVSIDNFQSGLLWCRKRPSQSRKDRSACRRTDWHDKGGAAWCSPGYVPQRGVYVCS